MSRFQPAVKEQLKGRVALCGPTGSGKTWTALGWATELAQGGKVALIDTERRSASLYAPDFEFDKLDWAPPYDPNQLIEAIRDAEQAGYAVLIVDSLTHFWNGEGGTLDVVDRAAAKAHGNTYAGWRDGTPLQRNMVDALLAADMHIIVTMRSKMDYAQEKDERTGKTKIVKLGMAPEQRSGIEYEFTLVGEMDESHKLTFTKSRCAALADVVIHPHRERDAAKTFAAWLEDGEPLATAEDRQRVNKAYQALPEEHRAAAMAELVEAFGPARALRAKDVDAAVAVLENYSA